jgi:hypothetical protein
MQPGARTASKEKQGKPNKTKEISLDFLVFPWPILRFSKSYGESKEKISVPPARPALVATTGIA